MMTRRSSFSCGRSCQFEHNLSLDLANLQELWFWQVTSTSAKHDNLLESHLLHNSFMTTRLKCFPFAFIDQRFPHKNQRSGNKGTKQALLWMVTTPGNGSRSVCAVEWNVSNDLTKWFPFSFNIQVVNNQWKRIVQSKKWKQFFWQHSDIPLQLCSHKALQKLLVLCWKRKQCWMIFYLCVFWWNRSYWTNMLSLKGSLSQAKWRK